MALTLTINARDQNFAGQIKSLLIDAAHVQLVLSYLFTSLKPAQLKTLEICDFYQNLKTWKEARAIETIKFELDQNDYHYQIISFRANLAILTYLQQEKIKYWSYRDPSGQANGLVLIIFELSDAQDMQEWDYLLTTLSTKQQNNLQVDYYNLWGIATTYGRTYQISDLDNWCFVDHQSNKWHPVMHNDFNDRVLLPIANHQLSAKECQSLITLQDLFYDIDHLEFNQWIKDHQKDHNQLCNLLTYNWPKTIWPIRPGRVKTYYDQYPHHRSIIDYLLCHSKRDKITINDLANAYLQVFKTINIDQETYVENIENGIPLYRLLTGNRQDQVHKFNFWNDYQNLLYHLEIKLREKDLKKKTNECSSNNYQELCNQIYQMSKQVNFIGHHYLVYQDAVFNCQVQKENPNDWKIDQALISDYDKLQSVLKQKQLYIINTMGRPYYRFDVHNSLHQDAKKRVDQFLMQIFSNDQSKINVYFQFIGYGSLANTDLRKALIIKGEGKNGKSTLINFTKRFLNQDNLALLPISRLGDEFSKIELQYKTLLFDTEGPAFIDEGVDDLKAIISGDEISSNVKYRHNRKWKSTTTMIIATNNQINFRNYSSAIGDRLYFIELTNRFDNDREKTNQSILDYLFGFDENHSERENQRNEQATLAYCDYLILNGIKQVLDLGVNLTIHQDHTKMLNYFETGTSLVLTWLVEENYLNFSDQSARYIEYSDQYLEMIQTKTIRGIFNEFQKWSEDNGYVKNQHNTTIKGLRRIFESYGAVSETKKINSSGKKENWFVIDNDKWKIRTGSDFVDPGGKI